MKINDTRPAYLSQLEDRNAVTLVKLDGKEHVWGSAAHVAALEAKLDATPGKTRIDNPTQARGFLREKGDVAPVRVERVERFDSPARPQTARQAAFARYDAAFHDRSGSHIDPSLQPAAERVDAEPGAYDPFAVYHKAFESSKGGARHG